MIQANFEHITLEVSVLHHGVLHWPGCPVRQALALGPQRVLDGVSTTVLVWLADILLMRKKPSLPALALLDLMGISPSLPLSQPLQPSLFWYYLLELSFYWSLVFTLPFDVKRKDFKEQIVHHAATIFLISFSYCANYIRIGTLVLVIHDAADCFLEPTKIFNYMKWKKTCDSLFMIFSAVFLISRLVVFPYTVLYNTYYYSMEIFQPFFGYYFVNTLLIILQLLHVFWSCLIIRMVYKFVLQGTMEKDMRSDTEESDKDEEREKIKEKEKNGVAYFSNVTSNNYIQRNGSEPLDNRTHLSNGHVKDR
ncbi:hypothetical protein Q9233_000479 [Columba guinea]|nr:hypothetical protein Q9233_000479 [Columba guinea]